MKILSIKIKNLASIGEAFIDFSAEPLASTGIFAITGATGAGKSTLLDAICLALYAKTPRYDLARESGVELVDASGSTISQGDVKSILMDGTAAGFAEVTFLGIDKQIYTSTWQVRRAKESITGRLQSDTVQLFNVTTNTPFAEKKTETLAEIEKLIGLNFHQFTRSVLLAQGDFTAFLKADKDSKASLLEKLTGTEIYSEISMVVFEKCRQATGKLKDLTLQLEGVEIFPEEVIAELITEKEDLEKHLQQAEIQIKNIEKEIQWYEILTALEKQKNEAEISKREAEDEIKKHEFEKATLSTIEDAQELKGHFDRKDRILSLLNKWNEERENLLDIIGDLQKKIAHADLLLQTNEKEIAEKKSYQKECQPLFAEARRLDILIAEKIKQAETARQQNELVLNRKNSQEKIVSDTKKRIEELSGIIHEHEQWCEKNAAGKLPAENISLLQSRLKDGETLIETISKDKNKQDTCQKTLKTSSENAGKLRQEMEERKTSLVALNEKIQQLHEKINNISITEISRKRDSLTDENTLILKSLSLWKQLFHEKEQAKISEEKTTGLLLQLSKNNQELLILENELNDAKIRKEQAANSLAKSRLTLSENVEDLRSQLHEGEECPVCGSLEHPYVLHNPQLDAVMQQLEKDTRECNDEYEKIIKEKSSLETSVNSLNHHISDIKKECAEKSELINSLEKDWKKLQLPRECFDLPEEKISLWLENQEVRIRKEILELKKQIDFYTETKGIIDIEAEQKKNKENELVKFGNKLHDIDWEIKSLEKNAEQLGESIQKNQDQLDTILKELNPFFSKPDWTEKWTHNPAEFVQKMIRFSETWNDKNEQLKKQKEEINPLNIRIVELENQFREIEEEFEKKSSELNTVLQEMDFLKQSRIAIFEGERIEDVEERLQADVDKSVEKYELEKSNHSNLKNKLLTQETELKNTQKSISEQENECRKVNEFIEKWLREYNEKNKAQITIDALKLMAEKDASWIKEQRDFFQKLNDTVVEKRSVFENKSMMVSNHRSVNIPAEELEDLQQQFENLTRTRENTNESKGAITQKLLQQEIQKKRFQSFQIQLEHAGKKADKWNKLSDLIGSQDGKKFRRIAQEYTLDILLVHANHHLEFLSKRYTLSRIPDTLALQILDRDMGDEIRTVFSLSGGESFLVSLALALGLASLSSDKMQVESLFIDEGFGSLDPETLDMAMDALDRLHSQGRKVGVISHVQEMKERITTQIQVEKLSSGRSKVIVVS